MSKVINLVELYAHSEVLRTFCILLTDAGFRVNVFTNLNVWNNLLDIQGIEKVAWHLQDADENKKGFILRNKDILDTGDLTIFTTLVSSLRFFASLKLRSVRILEYSKFLVLYMGMLAFVSLEANMHRRRMESPERIDIHLIKIACWYFILTDSLT